MAVLAGVTVTPADRFSTGPRDLCSVILHGRVAGVCSGKIEVMLDGRPRRRPRPPGVCVGIDLAGVPHRETGVAVFHRPTGAADRGRGGRGGPGLARMAGRRGTVAINAPLTCPLGRCCLDDDCRCRIDPGTRSVSVRDNHSCQPW